jgi:hypothetical protein
VSLLEAFYAPVRWVHDHPALAFAPAALLAGAAFAARSLPRHAPAFLWPAGAAAMWSAYGLYELRMHAWERTVTAPIRIDLLLIGPILYVVTAGAAVAVLRRLRLRRKA